MRITLERYVNLTVRIPLPTRPKQKYRFSFALCAVSSAITRCGSAKAYCASANGTPCLAWFSASFCSSHSKLGFHIARVYRGTAHQPIRTYGASAQPHDRPLRVPMTPANLKSLMGASPHAIASRRRGIAPARNAEIPRRFAPRDDKGMSFRAEREKSSAHASRALSHSSG